jgi:hypothetical protein
MASKGKLDLSPNDSLAEEVVDKLVDAGLVPKAKAAEVTAKVKAGTATSEDWKLWIDLGQAQKKSEGKDAAG